MGVCGCGKTSTGKLLAERFGGTFVDADDFHSPENIHRMASGSPLTDEDRFNWLHRLREVIEQHDSSGGLLILACSALKQSYRDLLRSDRSDIAFLHLHGSRELLRSRLEARAASGSHFMPAGLLDSQLETLESPEGEVSTWRFGIEESVEQVVQNAVRVLRIPLPKDSGSQGAIQGE